MNATASHTRERLFAELDYRENDGIQVSLLWHRATSRLTVFVTDARTNESFEIDVTPKTAREVFLHPFAYAASTSVVDTSLAAAA